MFCPNCGTQIPDGSAFCENCGAQLGAARAPVQQPAQQYQQPPYQQQPQMAKQQWQQQDAAPKKSKKRLILKIVGIVAAVFVVVNVVALASYGYLTPKGLNGATLAPQRLYEDDGVTVDITGLYYHKDDYAPYSLGLHVENRYDRIITVNCGDWKLYINGDGLSTAFGTGYIQPGQTYDSEIGIEFHDYDMSTGKLMRRIKTLTFPLEITLYDAEHNELDKYTTETYTLKTSLAK